LIRFDFALALDLPNEEYYNKDYTTNLDFKGWLWKLFPNILVPKKTLCYAHNIT